MKGVVISIRDNSNGPPTIFLEAPERFSGGRTGHPFQLGALPSRADPLPEDHVQLSGQHLYKLLTAHPAVKEALEEALRAEQGEKCPIYFELGPEGDSCPWECLYGPAAAFLALDQRWPIARLKGSLSKSRAEYAFTGPVKALAVLSATGADAQTNVSARVELQRLVGAFQGSGAPFRLRLLVCEEDLMAFVVALKDDRLSCDLIKGKDELLKEIADFGPNLLHFFCHATSVPKPHVRIGTVVDWELEREGSLLLEALEVRQRGDDQLAVWLLTLNCCESAAAARDARSLAGLLVAAGFPSVVGMRERVASANAHVFCERFFASVLQLVNSVPFNDLQEIEWASVLWEARQSICVKNHPGRLLSDVAPGSLEWALPVLYTSPRPFRLRRAPNAPVPSLAKVRDEFAEWKELKSERQKIADEADVPSAMKAGLLAAIDARVLELEQSLSS